MRTFLCEQVKMSASLVSLAFQALYRFFPKGFQPLEGKYKLPYTFFYYHGEEGDKNVVTTVGHGYPTETAVTTPILGGYDTDLPVKDGSHGICLLLVGGVIMGALQESPSTGHYVSTEFPPNETPYVEFRWYTWDKKTLKTFLIRYRNGELINEDGTSCELSNVHVGYNSAWIWVVIDDSTYIVECRKKECIIIWSMEHY